MIVWLHFYNVATRFVLIALLELHLTVYRLNGVPHAIMDHRLCKLTLTLPNIYNNSKVANQPRNNAMLNLVTCMVSTIFVIHANRV
jgi:hypothetical protein